jgi:hypothetical protein
MLQLVDGAEPEFRPLATDSEAIVETDRPYPSPGYLIAGLRIPHNSIAICATSRWPGDEGRGNNPKAKRISFTNNTSRERKMRRKGSQLFDDCVDAVLPIACTVTAYLVITALLPL